VALPAIAAARRAAAQLLLSAVPQSIDIDICCKPGPQQQTRRTLLQRADKTDRRTDRRTPYRYIDPAPHGVNNESSLTCSEQDCKLVVATHRDRSRLSPTVAATTRT